MAPFHDGEMSERLKEPVLKTGDAQASVGSNPTLSATLSLPRPRTNLTDGEVPKRPKGLPCSGSRVSKHRREGSHPSFSAKSEQALYRLLRLFY